MSSVALNLGIESLLAAQTALDTIGHNLANANTPGYSRQNVLLSAAPTLRYGNRLVGNGVRANDIVSVRDLLVDRRILVQRASVARLDATIAGLGDMESLLGSLGEGSLSGLLSGFFTSISSLSTDPSDAVLRQDALRAGTDFADRLRDLREGLVRQRADAVAQVSAQVTQVNTLTREIANLNGAVVSAELDGSHANDLRDARDEKLRALAELVDISVTERDDGSVQVAMRDLTLVTGTHHVSLESVTSAGGDLVLRPVGASHGVTPQGGSLAGLLDLVRDIIPARIEELDRLAHELAFEVNKAHSTGVPLSGPFQSLQSANGLRDTNGDGRYDDELLARAGLPFPIQDGALIVNITDRETGEVQTHRIPIDPEDTTAGDLVAALDAIPQLSATIQDDGRISLRASNGYGFDFAARSFPASGSLGGSQVSITGTFAGDAPAELTFRPRSAGDVGATGDLLVDVFDANGSLVATLDVGADYVPGTELDLGNGLKASFGLGSITNADSFGVSAVVDGDSSDVLAALGFNEFFRGSDASDLQVSDRLTADPRLLAASATGADGDGGVLASILAASERASSALGGSTPGEFVGAIAAGIGFDQSSAQLARDTEQALHDGLVAQRDARSGVNVDEELVDMLRFQQAYQASAQFIQVVNSLNDELLRIL